MKRITQIVEMIKPVYDFKAAKKETDYTTSFFTTGSRYDMICMNSGRKRLEFSGPKGKAGPAPGDLNDQRVNGSWPRAKGGSSGWNDIQ